VNKRFSKVKYMNFCYHLFCWWYLVLCRVCVLGIWCYFFSHCLLLVFQLCIFWSTSACWSIFQLFQYNPIDHIMQI